MYAYCCLRLSYSCLISGTLTANGQGEKDMFEGQFALKSTYSQDKVMRIIFSLVYYIIFCYGFRHPHDFPRPLVHNPVVATQMRVTREGNSEGLRKTSERKS